MITRPTSLRCTNCGAVKSARHGIFELLPPGAAAPRLDVYAGPLGRLYDSGVNNRRLASGLGRIMWGADIARMYRVMDEAVTAPAGTVIIDAPVGGGTAFAGAGDRLHGLLVGVDMSLPMLYRAAERRGTQGLAAQVVLARADATRLPMLDACADRLLCFNSLHVIREKEAVLREFRRVLKPGGRLVGTTLVSDIPPPWRLAVAASRLGLFFVPPRSDRLARLARSSGFQRWSADRVGAMLYFRGE
jgi:SAM-dependent methyltransferase